MLLTTDVQLDWKTRNSAKLKSATAEIARDADVRAHSLSLLSNLSPVYIIYVH